MAMAICGRIKPMGLLEFVTEFKTAVKNEWKKDIMSDSTISTPPAPLFPTTSLSASGTTLDTPNVTISSQPEISPALTVASDPAVTTIAAVSDITTNPTAFMSIPVITPGSAGAPVVSSPSVSTLSVTTGTIVTRSLSAASAEYEKLIGDLETFVGSKEKFIEAYIAAELAKLKAAAEVAYTDAISEKQKLVSAVESEVTIIKGWLAKRFDTLKASL